MSAPTTIYANGSTTVTCDIDRASRTTSYNKVLKTTTPSAEFAQTAKSAADETRYTNSTGVGIDSAESVRIGRKDIKDIYTNSNISEAVKLPNKAGVQLLNEVSCNLVARDSKTGQEYHFPVEGRLVVKFPVSAPMNLDCLKFLENELLNVAELQSAIAETANVVDKTGTEKPLAHYEASAANQWITEARGDIFVEI